jgi:hypothetical protein
LWVLGASGIRKRIWPGISQTFDHFPNQICPERQRFATQFMIFYRMCYGISVKGGRLGTQVYLWTLPNSNKRSFYIRKIIYFCSSHASHCQGRVYMHKALSHTLCKGEAPSVELISCPESWSCFMVLYWFLKIR